MATPKVVLSREGHGTKEHGMDVTCPSCGHSKVRVAGILNSNEPREVKLEDTETEGKEEEWGLWLGRQSP